MFCEDCVGVLRSLWVFCEGCGCFVMVVGVL